MKALIQEFSDYLRIEKRNSPHTVSAYRRDLSRFSAEFAGQKVDSVTTANIRDFLISLREQGLSPASVARSLSSIKSFFKYLCQDKQFQDNPAEILETPKRWRKHRNHCSCRPWKNHFSGLSATAKRYVSRKRTVWNLYHGQQ